MYCGGGKWLQLCGKLFTKHLYTVVDIVGLYIGFILVYYIVSNRYTCVLQLIISFLQKLAWYTGWFFKDKWSKSYSTSVIQKVFVHAKENGVYLCIVLVMNLHTLAHCSIQTIQWFIFVVWVYINHMTFIIIK